MPIETIKCQECGSADVTEFKPGSYICSHCESVFKVVSPPSPGAVGCEIEGCGVLAVGRCKVCGQAFCASHGGTTGFGSTCFGQCFETAREDYQKDYQAAKEASEARETAYWLKTRLTPARFIELAAAAGNPGIRSWTINQLGPRTFRTGLRRKLVTDPTSYSVIGSYVIDGWSPGRWAITTEARVHWAHWTFTRNNDTVDHCDWSNSSVIPEPEIRFDCDDFYAWDEHLMDENLRSLSRQIGLSVPDG